MRVVFLHEVRLSDRTDLNSLEVYWEKRTINSTHNLAPEREDSLPLNELYILKNQLQLFPRLHYGCYMYLIKTQSRLSQSWAFFGWCWWWLIGCIRSYWLSVRSNWCEKSRGGFYVYRSEKHVGGIVIKSLMIVREKILTYILDGKLLEIDKRHDMMPLPGGEGSVDLRTMVLDRNIFTNTYVIRSQYDIWVIF